nr:uncharacterized protein LOC111505511 [Leptinotarsa decemlineata]
MNSVQQETRQQNEELVIDSVLSTQPELGPSIPDGGYGWVVFMATLFFQALIPSITVSFGIFLIFSRLPNLTKDDRDPKLWDDNFIYVPLFFTCAWTLADPSIRSLISNSTWPRLVATAGTCLTCAGLLFMWMGFADYGKNILFPLAGITTGIGASIQISQCEIILTQYFKFKHTILVHITQGVTSVGFILTPIVLGNQILNSHLLKVILWYQAIILQGLIFNLTFKKPSYLKSKQASRYNYITNNPDDEEDIFSKNSRELQIKRQNSSGTNVTIEKHPIPSSTEPSTSGHSTSITNPKVIQKWETFEDDAEDEREKNKYEVLKQDWETFDEDEDLENIKDSHDDQKGKENIKAGNLQLELSFAERNNNNELTTNISGVPMPLFSDLPVNNNTTYSYDALEQDIGSHRPPAVFMPAVSQRSSIFSSLELLQQPTFYKSLLTVITTKFSIFVYYTLFPIYLYQELGNIHIKTVSSIIGTLALSGLMFSGVSYWINIDRKRRAICLWFLCWLGSFGYFMISDSDKSNILIFGAIQVTISIATLQYIGMPLLGLTLRGETNKEFNLISIMSGFAFLFFLIIDSSFKNCFRLMALMHFFTGVVWFSNYIYKKIMK